MRRCPQSSGPQISTIGCGHNDWSQHDGQNYRKSIRPINQLVNIFIFTDAHTSDIAILAVYLYIQNTSGALEKALEIGPVPPNVRRAR
jgi:hypothetical protein